MAKVVLGLFDDMGKARKAVSALETEGFTRENIDLRSGEQLIRQGAEPASGEGEEGEGLWASIKQLFAGSSSEGKLSDGELHGVRAGDALVTVLADDAEAERAARIIDDHGAEDIESRVGEASAPGAPAARATGAGERRIPVAEEELRVGKRDVDAGGVRVRSRIIERPVEQSVSLREEDVEVQRRPVDRPAAVEGEGAFQEQSFEVHAHSEEPVAEKRTRVKEEVTVKKESRQREAQVRDTVRSTDVQVEKLSPDEEREFAAYAGEFENDWQAKHASRTGLQYRDVEPGYQYGYRLARSGRYGGNDWAAIEAQAKRDWDQRGYGPWEQYREAVRSGWERARR